MIIKAKPFIKWVDGKIYIIRIDTIKNAAGNNNFMLSVKNWIQRTWCNRHYGEDRTDMAGLKLSQCCIFS